MKIIKETRADRLIHSARGYSKWYFGLLVGLMVVSGCATTSYQKIETVPILLAQKEIPEQQLLDVNILIFESESVSAAKVEQEGTHPEIRKAEAHFIPYHLKDTLQRTSHWGAVRVVPAVTEGAELLVRGEIVESNGENLALRIKAVDAAGALWLEKEYKMKANKSVYGGSGPGQPDPYQNVYNLIANDLVRFKQKLTGQEISTIRRTAQLRFARDFAPAAFGGYLGTDDNDQPVVVRIPSDDDPMMARVMSIRDREYMFIDTLNAQYEKFYTDMQPSYMNWRQLNLDERLALQKIRREAMYRQLAGALLIAGAVFLGATDSGNTGGLQIGMVIIGGQVLVDGFNVSKEAQIHAEAIEELGESFGSEMKTVTMAFEGRQYELTGTAEEQFKKWRSLLQEIYYNETGFEPPPEDEPLNLPGENFP